MPVYLIRDFGSRTFISKNRVFRLCLRPAQHTNYHFSIYFIIIKKHILIVFNRLQSYCREWKVFSTSIVYYIGNISMYWPITSLFVCCDISYSFYV